MVIFHFVFAEMSTSSAAAEDDASDKGSDSGNESGGSSSSVSTLNPEKPMLSGRTMKIPLPGELVGAFTQPFLEYQSSRLHHPHKPSSCTNWLIKWLISFIPFTAEAREE